MNIIVCDDTERELTRYADLIEKLCEKNNIDANVVRYVNGMKLLLDLEDARLRADVIFLDIHMPHIDGVSIAGRLREMGYYGEIVFLTVSQQHFLAAFDVRASNYILKGRCKEPRIERILLEVCSAAMEKQKEYITFSGGGNTVNVAIQSIRYFEVNQRIITVHYENSKTFQFYSTMTKLENMLYQHGFVRTHRAFLVAIAYIHELRQEMVTLLDGAQIPVSRTYYAAVKRTLSPDEPAEKGKKRGVEK